MPARTSAIAMLRTLYVMRLPHLGTEDVRPSWSAIGRPRAGLEGYVGPHTRCPVHPGEGRGDGAPLARKGDGVGVRRGPGPGARRVAGVGRVEADELAVHLLAVAAVALARVRRGTAAEDDEPGEPNDLHVRAAAVRPGGGPVQVHDDGDQDELLAARIEELVATVGVQLDDLVERLPAAVAKAGGEAAGGGAGVIAGL